MSKKHCKCGRPLPHHLFEIGLSDHTCGCRRHYTLKDGKPVCDGTAANPFADYDEAHATQNRKR